MRGRRRYLTGRRKSKGGERYLLLLRVRVGEGFASREGFRKEVEGIVCGPPLAREESETIK